MSDLISRKPLVDMMQGVEDDIFAEAMREVNPNKAFVAGVVQEVKNQVLALSVVDSVPVVRCKECWKRGNERECPMCHEEFDGCDYCTIDYTSDDGFCHMGKKVANDMDAPTKDGGEE